MHDSYRSAFEERYASGEMRRLFSDQARFSTWRRLWIILAQAQQELGLPVTDEQIEEMQSHAHDIDYAAVLRYEQELKHDVMAHLHAFGDQCPKARPIIHLGATSCYVGDNTDILLMMQALDLIERRILSVMEILARFCERYKDLATLGYTHFQTAQPTTVGKRASLWLQDLLMDLGELRHVKDTIKPLGSKGATGTQASFLQLFEGDVDRVFQLDRIIARRMGFDRTVEVSGQTYSRKTDTLVLNLLSGIAQSAGKFANDIRLLQHEKELFEPFSDKQVGSSAMPYKRNPMKCERINALSRYLIANALNPAMTASAQWLERTLDDSANRRIAIAEGFLAADAILLLYGTVAGGLVVNEKAIREHLEAEIPFMATETIIMDCVKRGLDRQDVHERLRVLMLRAVESGENMLDLIEQDPGFCLTRERIRQLADPDAFTGIASQQTERFLEQSVYPLLEGFENTHKEDAGTLI